MDTLVSIVSSRAIVGLFIKLFGILFSFFYIFYSIVFLRQVGVMKKEVDFQDNGLLKTFAFVQVFISVGLLIFALFL